MGNESTVDCHPSSSELTSRVRPLIYLWTPKGFISAEQFLIFFSNLYIPPWLRKTDPSTKGGARGPWPSTFSEIVLCQGCFPGNLLLCHSPRHLQQHHLCLLVTSSVYLLWCRVCTFYCDLRKKRSTLLPEGRYVHIERQIHQKDLNLCHYITMPRLLLN